MIKNPDFLSETKNFFTYTWKARPCLVTTLFLQRGHSLPKEMLSPQKVTQHLLSFSCGVLRDVPKSPTRRENDCTTKITLGVFEGGLHSTSEFLCPLEIAGIGNHRWQTRLLQEVLILCDVVSSSVRNLCSAQYFIITLCLLKLHWQKMATM